MSISLDSLESIVSDHMANQPYSATCLDCGSNLNVDVSVDSEFDLTIQVTPCPVCLSEAAAAALNE